MTATDTPVEPVVRQRQPVAEPESEPKTTEVKTETSPPPGTDFASRIGLTAGTPQDTLRFLGDLTRNANLNGMPDDFGRFDIAFNGTDLTGLLNPRNRQNQNRDQALPADRVAATGDRTAASNGDRTVVPTGDRSVAPTGDRALAPTDISAARKTEALPEGVSKIERTRITGTGSRRDTEVEIRYGMDGKPNFVRDHLGEWASTDGGKTWKTGEPNLRMRRGEVSIDEKGNYSYGSEDYGVKSTFSPDGKVTRTITNGAGDQFSVAALVGKFGGQSFLVARH